VTEPSIGSLSVRASAHSVVVSSLIPGLGIVGVMLGLLILTDRLEPTRRYCGEVTPYILLGVGIAMTVYGVVFERGAGDTCS